MIYIWLNTCLSRTKKRKLCLCLKMRRLNVSSIYWSSKIAVLTWPGKLPVNASSANWLNDSINALFWCIISITPSYLSFVQYEYEMPMFNAHLLRNEANIKIKWCACPSGSLCRLRAWYQSSNSTLQHFNFSLEHNLKIFRNEISDAWLISTTSSTSLSGWKPFYIFPCSNKLRLKNDA